MSINNILYYWGVFSGEGRGPKTPERPVGESNVVAKINENKKKRKWIGRIECKGTPGDGQAQRLFIGDRLIEELWVLGDNLAMLLTVFC